MFSKLELQVAQYDVSRSYSKYIFEFLRYGKLLLRVIIDPSYNYLVKNKYKLILTLDN
jgi:hypothetical protein